MRCIIVHWSENMLASWYNIARMSAETQYVIWMRCMKIGMGGADARSEASLMVSEKMKAAAQASAILLSGGSTRTVEKLYRRKVQANVRRLSKA
jgi:hypothetical protein